MKLSTSSKSVASIVLTGELLSGEATYKLNVPPGVPRRDSWSVIAYSKETQGARPGG